MEPKTEMMHSAELLVRPIHFHCLPQEILTEDFGRCLYIVHTVSVGLEHLNQLQRWG